MRKNLDALGVFCAAILIFFLIGAPKKLKKPSQSICVENPDISSDSNIPTSTDRLFGMFHTSSSKGNQAEIYNLSNDAQGAILDLIDSKGQVKTRCTLTLDGNRRVEIPLEKYTASLKSENAVARLTAVSKHVNGRIAQSGSFSAFTPAFTSQVALLLPETPQTTAGERSVLIANLESESKNFIISGRQTHPFEPVAVILEAGQQKYINLTEVASPKELEALLVTPVDSNGKLTKGRFFASYIYSSTQATKDLEKKALGKYSSNSRSLAALNPILMPSYITVRKAIIRPGAEALKIDGKLHLLNMSEEVAKVVLYFQTPDGDLLDIKDNSKFCVGASSVKDGKVELLIPANGNLDCNTNVILSELGQTSGQIVLMPEKPGVVVAELVSRIRQKGTKEESFYITNAKILSPSGNTAAVLWNKSQNSDNFLNIYNPKDKALSFEIKLELADGKTKTHKFSVPALASKSISLNKTFEGSKLGQKGSVRVKAPVLLDVLQILVSKTTPSVNVIEAEYYSAEEEEKQEIDEEKGSLVPGGAPTNPSMKCSPPVNDLRADLNRDGMVDEADRQILNQNFGKKPTSRCDGDIDGDGDVDADDRVQLGAQWTAEGGIDSDNDGYFDAKDCSPKDPERWRDSAFPDPDGDEIRNSLAISSVKCFGELIPKGFTVSENGPDNCPINTNSEQSDGDGDGIGDACSVVIDPIDEDVVPLSEGDSFPNPQTFKPLKSNPNGLKGEISTEAGK